jgi:CRISPR-associated protein Csb1
MEPIFKKELYSSLVPQVRIKLKDADEVNLLDAGHRAADAVVRFSKTYGPKFWDAFSKYRKNRDCSDLVRLAPTSLIFGVWDSRGTGVKIQRMVRSVIRAYNVIKAERSATYRAAYDYTANDMIDPTLDKRSGKNNVLSQQGFKSSLATKTHGGVLVKGNIQQEAVINLVALRTLTSDLATKRYLLGLALVALSYRDQEGFNLREGCLLCAASTKDFDGNWRVVNLDSSEDDKILKDFNHESALDFAQRTAECISIEPLDPDAFDKETATKWLAIKDKHKVLQKVKHPSEAVGEELTPTGKGKPTPAVSDSNTEARSK